MRAQPDNLSMLLKLADSGCSEHTQPIFSNSKIIKSNKSKALPEFGREGGNFSGTERRKEASGVGASYVRMRCVTHACLLY